MARLTASTTTSASLAGENFGGITGRKVLQLTMAGTNIVEAKPFEKKRVCHICQ